MAECILVLGPHCDSDRREPAPENGDFWLAYDEKYIYFAARLEDKEPEKISATERQKNASFDRDDFVGLTIGLGGYQNDFESFQFNPLGTSSLSLAGGSAAKIEWQGEFESAARITPMGWEGEARIPWQLLQLNGFVKGDVRFNVYRIMPRRTNAYVFGKQSPQHPEDQPLWDGVEPPRPKHDSTLHLLPYGYLGWDPDSGYLANGGLDFKTELPGRIGIAGTINPDFRNIEQSVIPLSFSRFELLADETRPFFLEGSQYLNTPLFASQRIGDFDFGANVHGALNARMSFGLLNTFDFGRNRSSVVSTSYQFDSTWSGNLSATSLETRDQRNEAVAANLAYSRGAFYAEASTANSSDREVGQGGQYAASAGYYDERLSVGVSAESTTAGFFPALGYAPETDYKGFTAYSGYNQSLSRGWLERWSVSASGSSYVRQNGEFYSNSLSASGRLSLRNGVSLRVSGSRGRYLEDRDYSTSIGISYPTFVAPLSVNLSATRARFAGSPYRSWSADIGYIVGSKYSLSLTHQHQDYLGSRDQTVFGLSAKIAIDQEIGFRLLDRPNSTNWYLTYRKSGGRGAEYFLIVGDPSASEFRGSLVLKGTFPIEIR